MPPPTATVLLVVLSLTTTTTLAATFIFENKCGFTVWPGLLSNAGTPPLPTTGFELPSSTSLSLQFPSSWSGRLWGRTGCSIVPDSNLFQCSTGDCGSGTLPCSGAGAKPPATLAEFTLSSSSQSMDFYDVSLVDGYNLPLVVSPSTPSCAPTGCPADLNAACPTELRAGDACMSACEAFGTPEYCCSGEFSNPNTCRPSPYSQMFKAACPASYSYAFDDATSTFTCAGGGDYVVTFCPASAPSSQKSSRDTTPPKTTTTEAASAAAVSENEAWLASLATGSAATTLGERIHASVSYLLAVAAATTCILVPSSLL